MTIVKSATESTNNLCAICSCEEVVCCVGDGDD